MKSNEFITEDELVTLPLNKFFKSDDDLKNKIVSATNAVMNAYRQQARKKHNQVPFSNRIAQELKNYILKSMSESYKIYSENELTELRHAINKTISIHYMEYILNGIIY